MSKESVRADSGGCSCSGLIVFILIVAALGWGLPTPWGVFHIDLFPPAIRLQEASNE